MRGYGLVAALLIALPLEKHGPRQLALPAKNGHVSDAASGRKKSDLLPEVMDQFQVHAVRVKFSIGCELPAGQG